MVFRESSSVGDRVLVVDDEPDAAETTALMLEARGLDTLTETDPWGVSGRIDERVGCVVSDYRMPGLDGLELLAEVRESHPDLPFVLFTAEGSETIASRAIESGVDYYLQKGNEEQYDRLANRVGAAIERARTERALAKRRRQFETVFENAFDGIFVLDVAEAVVVDANPRACELLGYPRDDLVGRDVRDIHPDDFEEYLRLGRELVDADRRCRVESTCYTRNGDAVPSDITAAPMEYDGRTYLLTIMRPRRAET